MEKTILSEGEFNQIVDKYANFVFRIAMVKTKNKQDAEDVFQDTFFKLYKCGIAFQSEEHIKSWLIKVTINASIDLLKSFWHSRMTGLDEELPFEDKSDMQLWEEIKKLPAKYRIPIYLFYYEGYSTEEIAGFSNENPTTTRSKLHRGRKMLSERLGDSDDWL